MTGTAPLFEQYFKEHQPVSSSLLPTLGLMVLTDLARGWLDQERPFRLDRQGAPMVQGPWLRVGEAQHGPW